MKTISTVMLAVFVSATASLAAAKQQGPAATTTQHQSGQLATQTVQSYIIDAFGDVDGLLLSDGWLVKFPAHHSSEVLSKVKPGDSITVAGAMTPSRVIEAWTLTNTQSGATVVRAPKPKFAPKLPKHLRTATLRPLEAHGRISHLVHGKKGEVKLAVLEDGTALRLGKQARWIVGAQLAVGRQITARGVGTQNDSGRALEVTEIGVDDGPMSSLYGVAR